MRAEGGIIHPPILPFLCHSGEPIIPLNCLSHNNDIEIHVNIDKDEVRRINERITSILGR